MPGTKQRSIRRKKISPTHKRAFQKSTTLPSSALAEATSRRAPSLFRYWHSFNFARCKSTTDPFHAYRHCQRRERNSVRLPTHYLCNISSCSNDESVGNKPLICCCTSRSRWTKESVKKVLLVARSAQVAQ